MRVASALLTLPLAALLLAGCGVDPAAERRDLVLGISEAAKAGDEDAVRAQVDALLELVERQVADEELTADEADRLRALAARVRIGADLLDEELQARRKAEADAERLQRERDEAQRLLEEERRKAEEARGKGEKDGDGDKGEGKGDKDD